MYTHGFGLGNDFKGYVSSGSNSDIIFTACVQKKMRIACFKFQVSSLFYFHICSCYKGLFSNVIKCPTAFYSGFLFLYFILFWTKFSQTSFINAH